jgi:hypothetical protein
MSIEALSWAFNLSLQNSGMKLTLLALANYSNEEGEAFPSQKAIAEKTCLCERAIRTHLAMLEELKIITRKARTRANGSYTSDLFKLNIGMKLPSADSAVGKINQRQIIQDPAADSSTSQRQILPNPAADSAEPDPTLNTTITKTLTVTKEDPIAAAKAAAEEKAVLESNLQAACRETWKSYSDAYFNRYGIEPRRNQKINSMVKQFVQRIGFEESPHVAGFYVFHNEHFYVKKTHPVEMMLKDAEGLHTQWATGRTMTGTRARQIDQSQANYSVVDEALKLMERAA